MTKIDVKTSLISTENQVFNNIKGIKNNNHLHYRENDFSIKIDIEKNCVKMLRKNDQYIQQFHFEINSSKCVMTFSDNTVITIPVKTEKIFSDNSNLEIVYYINDEQYIYKVNIKEV